MNYAGSMFLGVVCIGLLVLYRFVVRFRKRSVQQWVDSHWNLEISSQRIVGPLNAQTSMDMISSLQRKLDLKYRHLDSRSVVIIGSDRQGHYNIYWVAFNRQTGKDYSHLDMATGKMLIVQLFGPLGLSKPCNSSTISVPAFRITSEVPNLAV